MHRVDYGFFHTLLGFNKDEETTSKRYPPLAPVLYDESRTRDPYKAFRSEYIMNVSLVV